MKEPAWLSYARRFVGQSEVPGKESNPWIASLWDKIGFTWLYKQLGGDDSTAPWCGAFVGAVFVDCGIPPAKNAQRAKAWLEWGDDLHEPFVGCVVVYERKGGGHVGFVVGRSVDGHLMTLGGNQRDRVSIAPFDQDRAIGYRWPKHNVLRVANLPILDSNGQVSTDES